MADRSLYSHTSTPMPTGLEFLAQYADRLSQLFTASVLPLSAVGGTGNVVTATLDPALTAGLVGGMKFTLTWAAANTGAVTLALNGGTAVPVLDPLGVDLTAGALTAGMRSLIEYVGGNFVILGSAGGGGGVDPYFVQITASQTWTKPGGYADDTPVLIEAWGAGASGGRTTGAGNLAGGGGGAHSQRRMRYADIPASVSISIGAGGASVTTGSVAGNAGGNTAVGALLTAYGGAGAGPGGGQFAPGTGGDAFWNGGTSTAGVAGSSVFGGSSGGPGNDVPANLPGGLSKFGGTGGAGAYAASASSGSAPGGGGGGVRSAGTGHSTGAGARGEVRIWIGGAA